eukprot:3852452-Rhodomonas_salina.2
MFHTAGFDPGPEALIGTASGRTRDSDSTRLVVAGLDRPAPLRLTRISRFSKVADLQGEVSPAEMRQTDADREAAKPFR